MGEGPARDVGTEQCFRAMTAAHDLITSVWGKPSAMLMCAGGFAFTGDQEWFNRRVFWVDVEAVCRQLSTMHKDEMFCATLPGQTFWMEANRVTRVDQGTPFLEVRARSEWPARARIAKTDSLDYAPASGRRDLSDEDRKRLKEGLDRLANALVGGILFRSLHSMLAIEAQGRKCTFALVLRVGSDGNAETFEYDASACAFIPVQGVDAREAYLAGWECWATDLLAVLDGEIGPIALMFGRARLWNLLPQRLRFDLHEGLTKLSHPLSRPGQYLRNYERLWAKNKAVAPRFAGPPHARLARHVG